MFNGPEYTEENDKERLTNQLMRVKILMADSTWRTLDEISSVTSDPPASVSAQLRHLRKKRFGSYTIDRRPRGDRKRGLYEYRLMPPNETSEFSIKNRRSKLRQALEAIWKHPDTTKSQREIILKTMRGSDVK